ncbi:Hypothetical protein NTJ_06514 [Nesidiocoris tenuis]|uniref:Amino acid permease/ SLC12A domain-containing protein n=1 Tax=Nesidiocoris tenuis TaxID=355587 RepID=A0ABN7AS05_9HEMI|nr:Hypothetical protein NTJ_06514 [Nesidiocoris tenuis]
MNFLDFPPVAAYAAGCRFIGNSSHGGFRSACVTLTPFLVLMQLCALIGNTSILGAQVPTLSDILSEP